MQVFAGKTPSRTIRVFLFCFFSRGEACWHSEEKIGLYSWPRSTRPYPEPDSLGTLLYTLSRPNTETSSHIKTNIRVVEDILASREAPEEKPDMEQESESK